MTRKNNRKPNAHERLVKQKLLESYLEDATDYFDIRHLKDNQRFGVALIGEQWVAKRNTHKWHNELIPVPFDYWRELFGQDPPDEIDEILFRHEGHTGYSQIQSVCKGVGVLPEHQDAVKELCAIQPLNGRMVGITKDKGKRNYRVYVSRRKKNIVPEHPYSWVESFVRVDTEQIELWFDYLNELENSGLHHASDDVLSFLRIDVNETEQEIKEDIRLTRMYLRWIYNHQTDGYLPQGYNQVDCGRYCGEGVYSLQLAKKVARQIAIGEGYMYDIETAHHKIIQSMARSLDVLTPVLDEYIKDKKKYRKLLAAQANISEKLAKIALTAAINGWQGYKDLDNEDTKTKGRILQTDYFAAIDRELRCVRKAYETVSIDEISKQPLTKSGHKRTPKTELINHLFGMESEALVAGCKAHTDDELRPLIAEHDGWTTRADKPVEPAETAMKKATGVGFKLSKDKIEVPEI